MPKKTTAKPANSGTVIIEIGSLDKMPSDPKDPLVGTLELRLGPVEKSVDLNKVFALNGKSDSVWDLGFGVAELQVEVSHHEIHVVGVPLDVYHGGSPWGLITNQELINTFLQKLSHALEAKVASGTHISLKVVQLDVPAMVMLPGLHDISRSQHVEESLKGHLCGKTAKALAVSGSKTAKAIDSSTWLATKPAKKILVTAMPEKSTAVTKPMKNRKP